ncbi:MAG TPA: TDP-N-acetylfucosamine:lipid II N-acetylfucosaminyltransferase [Salinisphaeraceae bacterium]|nr:TDP-N-acetylfucosamine:lipid II N-acetylfucosaminyltransferase [Salinisphaeraceae bacterium]
MILHLADANKFTIAFFRFLQAELPQLDNEVIDLRHDRPWPPDLGYPIHKGRAPTLLPRLYHRVCKADKIIIHGLFKSAWIQFLLTQPWAYEKMHWAVWGGDLHAYESKRGRLSLEIKEALKRILIKRIGVLLTCIPGDVELARTWYGARGRYMECLMYESNTWHPPQREARRCDAINILAGNSANPSNNHSEIFAHLEKYRDQNIRIFAPLAYGTQVYADAVIRAGTELFGDKFIPMTEFVAYQDYLAFLGSIDIAVFNHARQQAMGTTITLLGMGKKVCMRRDTSLRALLEQLGLHIFNVADVDLAPLPADLARENKALARRNFSRQRLRAQLQLILLDQ